MIEWFHSVPLAWLPNAYAIELVQIVLSCIGVPLSLIGTWDAWIDRRIVHDSGYNGTRLFAARRNLREEVQRMMMHLALLYNGTVLIRFSPPDPGLVLSEDRLFQMIVTRLTTTFVIAVLSYKSYRDLRDRYDMRRLMKAAEQP
jgi:hypothetical protein